MNGLKMDFISSEALENASSMEKIYMIIERVKKGNVVIIEGELTISETTELFETSMRENDIENFVGVEIETLEKDTTSFLGFSKKKTTVNTIVGPANLMETVKKQSNFLSMVADFKDDNDEL